MSGAGIADFDRQLLELAESASLRVHVLLTKADKLKRGKAASALLAASKELGDRASAQLFSSLNRQGLDQAREALEQFLGAPGRTTDKKNPGVS